MPTIIQRGAERLEAVYSASLSLPKGASSVTVQELDLAVTLDFRKGDGQPSISSSEASAKHIVLTLADFDNPLGTAFDSEIGTSNGLPLYLSFTVYAIIGDKSEAHPQRILHYTVYRGEAR